MNLKNLVWNLKVENCLDFDNWNLEFIMDYKCGAPFYAVHKFRPTALPEVHD